MEIEIFSNEAQDALQITDKSRSIKSATAEPETEDFNDQELIKILIHEFGLNEEIMKNPEPLAHRNTKNCVHCKVVKKNPIFAN